jgi:uncharacterized SAM-binding protein YcdF (DUF218 family)
MTESLYPIIKACLLFPAVHFVLMALGILLSFVCPKTGRTLAITALLLLFLVSTPFGERLLSHSLKIYPSFKYSQLQPEAKAIVLLNSRGTIHEQNLRLGLIRRLHQDHQLPVIVSGKGGARPLAARLRHLFKTPVSYIDNTSANTWEHATTLYPYMKDNHLEPFYLIASSWHMKRAMWAFKAHGLNPIPLTISDAPTAPLFAWIPNTRSLTYANYAYYEHMGLLWYKVRKWLADRR